jgi:ATP-binding cassette subfamily B protein
LSSKLNQQEDQEEEQQEIIQPTPVIRHRFMFDFEETELEHPRRTLWKWMISYILPLKWKFLLFLGLLLIGSVITALTPAISATIIDKGIIRGNLTYILVMSVFYLSLMLVMAITSYLAQYGVAKISQKITFEIRNDLFFKLQDMSLTYFDQKSSGDVMSITTNDVTLLNQLVGGQFVAIINS